MRRVSDFSSMLKPDYDIWEMFLRDSGVTGMELLDALTNYYGMNEKIFNQEFLSTYKKRDL